ncbi:hypothetical protein GCM10009606_38480 [Nocardioides aquiterrae]|uniref:Uncharacterized protein n=1 Tax=Nocardioides aquiterrae TaxID=203799 RepID=A0ABN1ULM7_9ACTN
MRAGVSVGFLRSAGETRRVAPRYAAAPPSEYQRSRPSHQSLELEPVVGNPTDTPMCAGVSVGFLRSAGETRRVAPRYPAAPPSEYQRSRPSHQSLELEPVVGNPTDTP